MKKFFKKMWVMDSIKGRGEIKKIFIFISPFSKWRLRVIFQFLLLPPITEALQMPYQISIFYCKIKISSFIPLFISIFL